MSTYSLSTNAIVVSNQMLIFPNVHMHTCEDTKLVKFLIYILLSLLVALLTQFLFWKKAFKNLSTRQISFIVKITILKALF